MNRVNPLLTSVFAGEIGIARADITPPLGINARNWGAAAHDLADGVHRPLTATALVLSSSTHPSPLVLIAVDLGWWKSRDDEWLVRGGVIDALNVPPDSVLLSLSHTHAGPNLYREDREKPGGEHIEPYLLWLRDRLVALSREAQTNRVQATLSWRYGRCDLAQNRDLPDSSQPRFMVGWNPAEPADDTLLVGQIHESGTQRILGTVVNYACHPTTLAWENRLLSPDFPGAMRELVETATRAPCLFLQGASGDLGTAAQHGRAAAVADRLGRRLGHAVLSVIESWPDALHVVDQFVESGAPLGIAHPTAPPETPTLRARLDHVPLALKPLDTIAQIESALAHCDDRALRERLWRKRAIRRIVGDGADTAMPLWTWRLGEALLVAQPNEAYSPFQQTLRARFAPRPVIVLNVTNGYAGYLPPASQYPRDQYSVWQTPFAAGSLERLIEHTTEHLRTIAP